MPRLRSPRDDILAAARDNFRAEGPRGFTMRGVASIAGVSAPAIYRHFKDREGLLTELVNQGFDRFLQYLSRGLAGASPRERLMLTTMAYLDFAIENPTEYETIFMTAEIPGLNRFPEDFLAGRSSSFQFLVDRISESTAAGVLRNDDPAELAMYVWTHTHGFVSLYLVGRLGKDVPKVRAHYERSVARLFSGLEP